MSRLRLGRYTIELSRPDKVLFPDDGITKGDLADYYRRIADTMLPHLRGRPVAMLRFPDGIDGEGFFQKDLPDYFPDWVERVTVAKEGGRLTQLVCANAATLVYLANQACITPHVWLSRADELDHPDRLIFDLDPSGEDFDALRSAARALRELLGELGLTPFLMTTGSRGLHVVVPLRRRERFDEVRPFAQAVASALAQRHSDALTTEPRKEKRRGRIYIDALRNSYAQTAAAPYSVRPKPGAPVATPLAWEELDDPDLGPQRYHIGNILRRLAQRDDPWHHLARRASTLTAARKRLKRVAFD